MANAFKPFYRRALLKLSGEALKSDERAISAQVLERLAVQVKTLVNAGVELAIVPGAGNYCRGAALADKGLSRITGDHMGMLATILNALALRDVFEHHGVMTRVMSAIQVNYMVDPFERRQAMRHLSNGRVVIIPGGTGNPLVTTDSAASLRSLEIEADVLLKATNVDGVYSDDPKRDPNAALYTDLSYEEALHKELGVMDLAAFCQCRDHGMEIRVFNIDKPSGLVRVISQRNEGTTIK